MGSCFSVSLSCDQVVNYIFNWACGEANYIRNLEGNIEALQMTTQELKAMRDDLMGRIETAENRGQQRLAQVQLWLSRVEAVDLQVDELVTESSSQIQRLCLYGSCSMNPISTYRYGKKVFKMCKGVDDLRSRGVFEVVAADAPLSKVEKRPLPPTLGRKDTLERAWGHLMGDGVGILGLYGMGGVGKTTLLKQINNMLIEKRHNFDVVIWVVVSRNVQIQSIQEAIGDKIGFNSEEWKQNRERHMKASDIHNVLTRKRFVLFLDDIWSKVDLTEIGVPFPSKENGCKVVFTTRSKEVCGRMKVDANLEVQCLEWDDAWDLFTRKVGESTLINHPDIPHLAKAIARKCRGLPLALNVIGETMACKTSVQEWRLALDELTSSAIEFSGMEDEILPILKYSYDNLKDERYKSCFKYCALFPEDYPINKYDLVQYWIGEGIIDVKEDIEKAEYRGYEIIGTLVRVCLVMEDENDDIVTMHDVVREMALWVASDLGNQMENFIVQAGAKLREMPKERNWKIVRRVSLMDNRIKEISGSPQCLELETLFLQRNDLVNISGDFFRFMPRLLVLDLSDNMALVELPEEISELASLQYLSLTYTKIKRLPTGFRELKKLTHLNLDYTRELESISGISCLSRLKVLELVDSSVKVDVDLLKELQLLEHLKVLTITVSESSALQQLLSDQKLASCTRILSINNDELVSSRISFTMTMDRLYDLRMGGCNNPEIEKDLTCFRNLSNVSLVQCKSGVRDLTWLIYAPNLRDLMVHSCTEVEEIIRKEKTNGIIPFLRLHTLYLQLLPELKSICVTPLPFPCLKYITVIECPKLMKLPLDSNSVPMIDENNFAIIASEEWIEWIEWEDDATQQRFLRCQNYL